MASRDIDAFHAHLDACEQCRNGPFNLCPRGATLLQQTADASPTRDPALLQRERQPE
jgi:hypothetical protein